MGGHLVVRIVGMLLWLRVKNTSLPSSARVQGVKPGGYVKNTPPRSNFSVSILLLGKTNCKARWQSIGGNLQMTVGSHRNPC